MAFEATATDIQAGQSFIGELEGRVQEIAQRASDQPLVWVFPRFEESIWSGQHFRSPRGLLDAMLPLIDAGKLVLVGEIEPSAYETALQLRPRIATIFEVVRVPPLTEDDALEVCREWLAASGSEMAEESLTEAYELASHYLPGSAAPGGVLRLLKASKGHQERDERVGPITTQDLLATLSEATGLPLHVLDPRAPLDLVDVERFFSERVLGQPEPVKTLVERIAMIKAGLTDPTRPLGVFLFVGPTGTGKTEIAKALAEFLFGSSDKLVRLDMSEYQTPEGFERLLGETSSGDPGGPTLASAVRKDPFSVVLLDEFEKAHPNVWNLFLQVFDDGRLTDAAGHTADFRHCVIILTANIGSAIPTRAGLGFTKEERQFDPAEVTKAVESSFSPEFLNRLDRVVVFRPLDREVMRAILEHELAAVLQRRGFRIHPWAVEWDDAARDFLVKRGFSERYGARPLKRAVEEHLLAPLAVAIVGRRFPEGDQFLFISARGDRLAVEFIDPDGDGRAAETESVGAAPAGLEAMILDPRGDTSEVQFLVERMSGLRGRIGAEAWGEQKNAALATTQDPDFWELEDRVELLDRIEYMDRIEAAMRTAEGLLRRLTNGRRNGKPAKLVALLAERIYLLDCALAGVDCGVAADAVLTIRPPSSAVDDSEVHGFIDELVRMYVGWGNKRGMRIEPGAGQDGARELAVAGLGAFTILRPESGLHVLELPESYGSFRRIGVSVDVRPVPPSEADEPDTTRTVVRRYRRDPSPLVRDSVRGWRTGRLDRVLDGDFDVIVD
jgi:ATP-dependent Clp protease ATP-binding subunit ClpC